MRLEEELARRSRFGMRPGLEAITAACRLSGDPQRMFKAVHIAGTNGKGAVSVMMEAALRSSGMKVGRYTSPHLVRINERIFLDGRPVADGLLQVPEAEGMPELTYFELLTLIAYRLYAAERVDIAVMETGLGGRLDATNICNSVISVITRIGLDHCDWLGDTVERIAAEKAGIIRPGVPVVLGANDEPVRKVVEARAKALSSPYYYAPEIADESMIPVDFSLKGAFNRENAITAIAALKIMGVDDLSSFGGLVWPGRFQQVRNFLIDGAHNPPAAKALAESLGEGRYDLIAGFCGDKDADEVLRILSPHVLNAFAVKTSNPRSLEAAETARKMTDAGMTAKATTLAEALKTGRPTLICGSLFLAGEALVALGAYPWEVRFDPAERLTGVISGDLDLPSAERK